MRTITAIGLLLAPALLWAEEDLSKQLSEATKKYASTPVLLAYKFKPGEVVRTKITHQVAVDTKVKGVSQQAKTRSVSAKTLQIVSVSKEGNFTLRHQVDWVDMWNSVTDRPEVKYDSRTDQTAPPGYETVKENVGKVLATITIDPTGRIVDRSDAVKQFNPGIGDLFVPFPAQAVKIGDKWHIPDEIKVRDDQGRVKPVQVRQQYELRNVEAGVATISVVTQVLTPIDDPKLESQLVQRMQKGTVKFDLDAGRILSRQMDLNETVLGFSGPDSSMEYVARYTEEPLPDVASKSPAAKK
jgi:hypothetical protein